MLLRSLLCVLRLLVLLVVLAGHLLLGAELVLSTISGSHATSWHSTSHTSIHTSIALHASHISTHHVRVHSSGILLVHHHLLHHHLLLHHGLLVHLSLVSVEASDIWNELWLLRLRLLLLGSWLTKGIKWLLSGSWSRLSWL